MASFTVEKKQNLIDICLQVYGTTQLLFKLAKDNNLQIDSDINAGDVLEYDETQGDRAIVAKATTNGTNFINPGFTTEGVGYWIIEDTFTVQ